MTYGEIVSFIWGVADLIRDSFRRVPPPPVPGSNEVVTKDGDPPREKR